MDSVIKQLLTLAFFAVVVQCHPQCLDFRPPFESESPLQFCSNYTDFGCCTSEDDQKLQDTFRTLQATLAISDWNSCHGYLKDLMCLSCSPYAAHVYDAERTMQAKTFPGLCTGYCQEFVDRCRDVIPFLDPSLTGSSLLIHGHIFCQHVSLVDQDYCYPDLLTNPVLNGELQVQKETKEGCLCLEPVVENLTSALFARHAGDDTGRLFVAQQPGIVNILYPRSKLLMTPPFLNISSRVKVSRSMGDERGFLGMAFHPKFSENGRFFVYYTMELEDDEDLTDEDIELGIDELDHKVRISEMRVSAANPNVADPNFENILLDIKQPFPNHNGGELLFLDDGYLYAFVGDGGSAGDPFNLAQNKRSLLGKVLRLDVDSNRREAYSIPWDNPFVYEPGARREIFALGVRNIWRCGVDPGNRKTGAGRGRVLCGDVGQNAYEEVDLLRKGTNYGWRAKEGVECFDDDMCNEPIENEELPVHTYPHAIGKSVTGGHFYRGCESPALDGQYIYGDYFSGRMFSLEQKEDGGWRNKNVTLCGDDVCFNGLTNDYDIHILSFGQDEDGEVYMLTSRSSRPRRSDGRMFKVVDPLRRGNPSDCPPAQHRGRIQQNQLPQQTNQQSDGLVQGPTIRQIQVRVCGVTPSFLCQLMSVQADNNRNG
ncbi:HHIP-like protein 1 [Littorina saxatilis]|uniref:HHIP-like protein 1 n=1 Tax=Littorina saxatilis TaxID=31220 RepID=A0AAN9BUL9_9CAEN